MFLVSYLAHDTEYLTAVQERLALAKPPMTLVTARSAPELVNQAQTLPLRGVLVDVTWPRAIWTQLFGTLRNLRPELPVLALALGSTEDAWWQMADDLLRLDEPLDLFLHRLERVQAAPAEPAPFGLPVEPAPLSAGLPPLNGDTVPLLDHPQFRQFAEILSGQEEHVLVETFINWVQQACQTSRAMLLIRDLESGDFVLRGHRGLPSTLVPHCSFPQTAPICRMLATTGRILLKDHGGPLLTRDVLADMNLLQAVAAVPVLYDGQLVAILGLGPRLVGHDYSVTELQALFAIGGQVAAAMHHCRMNTSLRSQQEMTEQMLTVMPSGTIVLGSDHRIAFANPAATAMLGKSRAALQGMDLRTLPSPLGDLAYNALINSQDLPRQELTLAATGLPVAVSCFTLHTAAPSAMLMIEDLSPQKRLQEERERRVNLEVLTNLVHYLAHELRNPLVALSTFSTLMPARADDPDFQEFCSSVLGSEIGRVNLILEQLLVLTDHVELQIGNVDVNQVVERVTGTEEMQAALTVNLPGRLPSLRADAHRLETALMCLVRSCVRLTDPEKMTALRVEMEPEAVVFTLEAPLAAEVSPDWLLNPWAQLMDQSGRDVDLGVATAKYIFEEHGGSLSIQTTEKQLRINCRLPIVSDRSGHEEEWHEPEESARRR